jgi:hypothetical protein
MRKVASTSRQAQPFTISCQDLDLRQQPHKAPFL